MNMMDKLILLAAMEQLFGNTPEELETPPADRPHITPKLLKEFTQYSRLHNGEIQTIAIMTMEQDFTCRCHSNLMYGSAGECIVCIDPNDPEPCFRVSTVDFESLKRVGFKKV